MSNAPWALVVVVFAVSLGCATGRSQGLRGEYADPEVIELLSDRFSENDLQLIARKMAASLTEAPHFLALQEPPRVVVGRITNGTGEPIDTDALADKIQLELFRSGRFELLDARARRAIAKEYEYQQSGYVSADGAHGPGQQYAADYILTGSMAGLSQQQGSDRLRYYRMSLLASDLRTGVVRWAEEKELRKKFEVQGISPTASSRLKGVGYGLSGASLATGAGLLIAGLAHSRAERQDFEFYDCPNPVTGQPDFTCTRHFTVPARGPKPTLTRAGAGLLGAGLLLSLLTYALVPDGNPELEAGRGVALVPNREGATFVLSSRF